MFGPLVVVHYINDIGNCSDKLKFHLLTDDTSLLYANSDLKSLEKTVNAELLKFCEWLTAEIQLCHISSASKDTFLST